MSEPYCMAPSAPPRMADPSHPPFYRVRCPSVSDAERTSSESVIDALYSCIMRPNAVRLLPCRNAWDDVVVALSMAVAGGLHTSASELHHMSGVPMFRTLKAISRIEMAVV
jgi:hypothetical protein